MPARPVTAGRVAVLCLVALLAPRAAAQAPALAAAVEVRLPAAAELWFDGVAAPLRGERRTFSTPPLRPGLTYTYEVQARWRLGGQEVVRGERILVRAGDAVVVDFTRPRQAGGGPDHMAIREIARPSQLPGVVPAATETLAEMAALRGLPGHMALVEIDRKTGVATARRVDDVRPYLSIVEFDTPRR